MFDILELLPALIPPLSRERNLRIIQFLLAMPCFSDSSLAMLSGHDFILTAHSKQSTSSSAGIMAQNDSQGRVWFHLLNQHRCLHHFGFSSDICLMMPYPAQFRRQDELTTGGNSMQEASRNCFAFLVHFLPAI